MRVPEPVYDELQATAHMLGYTPAELLQRVWSTYRESDEFHEDFVFAQKAFARGDPDAVIKLLQQRRLERTRKTNESRSDR
jgi:hypothetical protein